MRNIQRLFFCKSFIFHAGLEKQAYYIVDNRKGICRQEMEIVWGLNDYLLFLFLFL